jgi:hypothetical protein
MGNTYNQIEFGGVRCSGIGSEEALTRFDECAACPRCLDCSVPGDTKVKPGWAFYGTNDIYRCPGKDQTAETACIGLSLENKSALAARWLRSDSGTFSAEAMKAQCSEAYSGPICGTCSSGCLIDHFVNQCVPL